MKTTAANRGRIRKQHDHFTSLTTTFSGILITTVILFVLYLSAGAYGH